MKAIDLIWPMLPALGMVAQIIRHVEEDRIDEIPIGPPAGSGRQPPRGTFGMIVDS